MPWGLKRFHDTGGLHFITWSCCDRQPLLATSESRDLLLKVLEQMRNRYRFGVVGFVVMPEHVHLLMSEPLVGNISSAICAVKLGFTRRVLPEKPHLWQNRPEVGHPEHPRHPPDAGQHLWMKRYYDFNVYSQPKIAEKLHYMHQNPVVRGLVEHPEQWAWSSFRAHACGEIGIVKVNDWGWWEKRITSGVS
jgi:putative transposase